jgi:hypothetical protein
MYLVLLLILARLLIVWVAHKTDKKYQAGGLGAVIWGILFGITLCLYFLPHTFMTGVALSWTAFTLAFAFGFFLSRFLDQPTCFQGAVTSSWFLMFAALVVWRHPRLLHWFMSL